jgi:hypothetical protein
MAWETVYSSLKYQTHVHRCNTLFFFMQLPTLRAYFTLRPLSCFCSQLVPFMHSPLSNPQNSQNLQRQKKEGWWILLFFGKLPFFSLWRFLLLCLQPVKQVLQICKLTSGEWKQRQIQPHIYCETIFCFTITVVCFAITIFCFAITIVYLQ